VPRGGNQVLALSKNNHRKKDRYASDRRKRKGVDLKKETKKRGTTGKGPRSSWKKGFWWWPTGKNKASFLKPEKVVLRLRGGGLVKQRKGEKKRGGPRKVMHQRGKGQSFSGLVAKSHGKGSPFSIVKRGATLWLGGKREIRVLSWRERVLLLGGDGVP